MALVGALGLLPTHEARAQSLAYVGGLQYATGNFIFTERTWSAYVSSGLTLSTGRLRTSVSVPVVIQDAGWVQYSGAGTMVPTGGMLRTDVDASVSGAASGMGGGMHGESMTPFSGMPFSRLGIGDPVGRVEFALTGTGILGRALSVVGAVKAPIAGVGSGYGTGEWDVGAGASAALIVAGTSLFAEAVYWKLGNPPGASLRNAMAYSVSAGRALPGGHWSVLGSVSGATSVWTGLTAPIQAGAGLGYLFASGTGLTVSAAAGLTRSAPSLATGLSWRVPLGKKQ